MPVNLSIKYAPTVISLLAGMASAMPAQTSIGKRTVPFDNPQVVCTGRDITPEDYGIVQGSMDRWLAGSNVAALGVGSYSAESGNAALAVCSYKNGVYGDGAEIDEFNFLVDKACGAYRSGYVWIEAWQKSYWRESSDGLVCDNIILSAGQQRAKIECNDSGCSPDGWKGTGFKTLPGKSKRGSLAKRQQFPGDYQTGCTGNTLNPGHYTSSQNCMHQWSTQKYGSATTPSNWSHDPDEIDQFNGIMDAKCGQYQSGWVYIPDWDKTYWRDIHDTQVCTNGAIGQISVYCSTDDDYGCVLSKINYGVQGGGENPPDIWNN